MKHLEKEWFYYQSTSAYGKNYPMYHCDFSTEELFAVTDLLITDYSSVVYDYLIYQKSFLLYAPDLEEYKQQRGFYLEYESLPAPVITSSDALEAAMRSRPGCRMPLIW